MLDSLYIHDNLILQKIYFEAVKKFMKRSETEICFIDICNYVYKKLVQRKQDVYSHSLHIVKEVCQIMHLKQNVIGTFILKYFWIIKK
jgi:hypothetical protein